MWCRIFGAHPLVPLFENRNYWPPCDTEEENQHTHRTADLWYFHWLTNSELAALKSWLRRTYSHLLKSAVNHLHAPCCDWERLKTSWDSRWKSKYKAKSGFFFFGKVTMFPDLSNRALANIKDIKVMSSLFWWRGGFRTLLLRANFEFWWKSNHV